MYVYCCFFYVFFIYLYQFNDIFNTFFLMIILVLEFFLYIKKGGSLIRNGLKVMCQWHTLPLGYQALKQEQEKEGNVLFMVILCWTCGKGPFR